MFYFILGNCSKDEFLKAITKIGISGFTDKDLLELFDKYDADQSGELDYKEFVGSLYGNTSISKKDEGKPSSPQEEVRKPSGKQSKKDYLQVEG